MIDKLLELCVRLVGLVVFGAAMLAMGRVIGVIESLGGAL